MTKLGRPPKPSAIKLLEGNPGKRPIASNEVKPVGAPVCPEWLGEVGQAYWADVMASMPEGFITQVDGQALGLYCHAWEVFHECRHAIAEDGAIAISEAGASYQHPNVGRLNRAVEQIMRIGGKFGFTPSDRVGLVHGNTEGEVDVFESLLRKRSHRN